MEASVSLVVTNFNAVST